MKAIFKVLKAGIFTSYQDLGRTGYLAHGISACGAMDKNLAARANSMVGNNISATLLEFIHTGPSLEIVGKGVIAILAVEADITVNGKPSEHLIEGTEGQVINIRMKKGVYGYIAVEGGFKTTSYLGSSSYHHLTGVGGGLIQDNQTIYQMSPRQNTKNLNAGIKWTDYQKNTIRIFRGVDEHLFNPAKLKDLFEELYTIMPETNRMGIVCEAEKKTKHDQSIISSPVLPGTIQLPPSGKLIILGNDGQSVGGYPRVGKIVREDYAILAQKRPGEKIKFVFIS